MDSYRNKFGNGPISVLHVASGDLWAGAEVQVFNLLRELSGRKGIRCGCVVLNEGELASRLRDARIPTYVLEENKQSVGALAFSLMRTLKQFRPDIVHTHRTKENFLGGVTAAITRNALSIRTVHGSIETAAAAPGLLRRQVIRALDRFVTQRLQRRTIAVSQPLARELATTTPPRKIVVIQNGVDVAALRRAASTGGMADQSNRIGICIAGRLVSVKRVDVFLEAARILSQEHADKYRFFVIGDGPLLGQLRRQAASLRIQNDCIFTGFLSNPLPLIGQMGALVMTSDHEGTPMVALESLSLGVPVVAHAVGGLVQLITGPEQGALVRSQDPSAIAKAIVSVSPRYQCPSNKLRSSVLPEAYTIQFCADAHISLYRGLLMRDCQHDIEN